MCSKYYDPEKPYYIPDWNGLVRDVNEILQGPPEGSANCQPIEPIDEVTDPHLWAVEDVEEVRERLKETCPDISFSEELILWRPEIIDEIEDEMREAWCDCETEPDEDDRVLCSYEQQAVHAGFSEEKCCGESHMVDPCFICEGMCHEVSWTGDYTPSPGPHNSPLYNTVCDTYRTAYSATTQFISYMNRISPSATRMEYFQTQVDQYAAEVDALIAQHKDECQGVNPKPPQCQQIEANICAAGKNAQENQGWVDDEVEYFQEYHDKAMVEMAKADTAAQENSAATMGLHGRFPPDANIFAECYGEELVGRNWYDYWNPEAGKLGDLFDYMMGFASTGTGVFIETRVYRVNSKKPTEKADYRKVSLSPGGFWYIEGWTSKFYNRPYSQTYNTQCDRWKCETLFPEIQCPGGNCSWLETNCYTFWWQQCWKMRTSCVGACWGFGSWIWSPLPEPDWDSFGTDEFHLYTKQRPGLEDNSEKRDEWLDLHYNWYDTHEKYDDRHEVYC